MRIKITMSKRRNYSASIFRKIPVGDFRLPISFGKVWNIKSSKVKNAE